MESGDGFLVRLRITGGELPPGLAARIADWAANWGRGQIELSNRGNLQLRGIAARDLPALQAALAEAGLLDDSAAGEAVRNVMASPLAGLDPSAVLDVRPLVAALERLLADDEDLHALPGKFGFAIDDGGSLALAADAADIGFVACPVRGFAVRFGGAANLWFGPCAPEELVALAARLASFFLTSKARRMRHLVAEQGATNIAAAAGLHPIEAPETRPRRDFLGVQPPGFVGIGLPFGRTTADDFALLDLGAGLRLTPWRAVLVPADPIEAGAAFAASLPASLILDAADPRRRVAACVGAPCCGRASTTVLADAARLAGYVPDGLLLHVSGCEKGCAHPRSAPITLVGHQGRYDLVRDGTAASLPVLRGLSLADAAAQL